MTSRDPRNHLEDNSNYSNEEMEVPNKRIKLDTNIDSNKEFVKRNFTKACELVSHNAYKNYAKRYQLTYIPVCIDKFSCVHTSGHDKKLKEVPLYVRNLIKFNMEKRMFYNALGVCMMSITSKQYLSHMILQHIVEIMLDTHEDLSTKYTSTDVIEKCKLILSLQFTVHCPCLNKDTRAVYINFLTSPMDRKEHTCSYRMEYDSDKGIIHFCFNRLEYELKADSKDEPLLDTSDIPEEYKQSVKGLFWQKEKFHIFEMLERNERIERLLAVLNSIVELLQFDLAIYQSKKDEGMRRQLRGIKHLMAEILWKGVQPGVITVICKQIMKLYCYFIHLEYPEEHIRVMSLWLNTMFGMFYMIENKPDTNYPTIGSCTTLLINKFNEIICGFPRKSIVNIIQRIKPVYIRHQISHLQCRAGLNSDENDTLKMVLTFLKKSQWNDFPNAKIEMLNVKRKIVKPNKILENLEMICRNVPLNITNRGIYKKLPTNFGVTESEIDQNHITNVLYIALLAYLDAYSVQTFQETLDELNEGVPKQYEPKSYEITVSHVRTYRNIYMMLKELRNIIDQMTTQIELPNNTSAILNMFKDVST